MTFTTMTCASAIAEEHRTRQTRRRFWIGVLLALAFITAVACGTPAPESTPVQPNPPAAEQDAPAAEPEKPAGVGDGQHAVGVDIKPGEYVTTDEAGPWGCYWARVHSFDGELQSIIANKNVSPGARGRVQVEKSDKGVEFTGGCTWKRVTK